MFAALDPDHFEKCFLNWINRTSKLTDGEVVAIDGKCVRGSYDYVNEKKAKHVITAYATQAHLCLGQKVTDQKSNEITAIPDLLETLAIKGCMVSIDAMGCQKILPKKLEAKKPITFWLSKKTKKGCISKLRMLLSKQQLKVQIPI